MKYKVDNAIILAAGLASRFVPLSYEKPKALISVKGEVLIERQIKQLKEVGINDIIIVVGYKKEEFNYLIDKYNVRLVFNKDYNTRNNNSSIYAVRKYLKNSYICVSDNYFTENPFEKEVDDSYYACQFSKGKTDEWCLKYNQENIITDIIIGGENMWYMSGQAFWNENFSKKFIEILEYEYNKPQTANKLWESIYKDHIDELKLKIKKYKDGTIFEFDSLDELRKFDKKYIECSTSKIIKNITKQLNCYEKNIICCNPFKNELNDIIGFSFINSNNNNKYLYLYESKKIAQIEE